MVDLGHYTAFLYFSIPTNIYISTFSYLIIHNFCKGLAKVFPSIRDCHLVRPDVSIHSLPGSTSWAPGNVFIITCIQDGVFPNGNSCHEVGRDQDQHGCFFKHSIPFWLGTSETNFSQMLKFNQRNKLPVLFPKPCSSEAVYAADIQKAIAFYLLNTTFFRWPGKRITLAAKRYSHLRTKKA